MSSYTNSDLVTDIGVFVTSKKANKIEKAISEFVAQNTNGNVVISYKDIRGIVKSAEQQLIARGISRDHHCGTRATMYFPVSLRKQNSRTIYRSLAVELSRQVTSWLVTKATLHTRRQRYSEVTTKPGSCALKDLFRSLVEESGFVNFNDALVCFYAAPYWKIGRIDYTDGNSILGAEDLVMGIMGHSFNKKERLKVLSILISDSISLFSKDDMLVRSAIDDLLVAFKLSANNIDI